MKKEKIRPCGKTMENCEQSFRVRFVVIFVFICSFFFAVIVTWLALLRQQQIKCTLHAAASAAFPSAFSFTIVFFLSSVCRPKTKKNKKIQQGNKSFHKNREKTTICCLFWGKLGEWSWAELWAERKLLPSEREKCQNGSLENSDQRDKTTTKSLKRNLQSTSNPNTTKFGGKNGGKLIALPVCFRS